MKTILETLEYLQARQSDVRVELLTFAGYPITEKNMVLLNKPSFYTVNALRRVLNSRDKIKQARIEINNLIH